MSRLRAFLSELKRRRVWRLAAVYAATAFVAVEAADLFFPRLAFPDWSVTLVVRLAVLGFPIALILAWVFETGPQGLRRTEPAPGAESLEPGRRVTLFVLGGLVAVLAGTGWWLWAGPGNRPPAIERLAVLPLANLMNDPGQDWFVEGMHDRLISELQEAGVAVIARTSVMPYGSGQTPVREIARDLDVDAVIEGSAFRIGDRVEIETRLVDVTTEQYLWRKSFESEMRNVPNLHRRAAREIARAIHAALGPQEEARLGRDRPVDPAAYEAYLKGMYHLNRFTPEGFERGLRYLHEAVELDPSHALTWAALGLGYNLLGHNAGPRDQFPKARAAALRALELDPDLAEAHTALGESLQYHDWDWDAARESFLRSLELSPELPVTRIHHAWQLVLFDRMDEAVTHMEHARRLDPLTPQWTAWLGTLAWYRGDYATAMAEAETVLELSPRNPFGHLIRGGALVGMGRHDEAIAQYLELPPSWGWALAHTYALAGRDQNARAILARFEADPGTIRGPYGPASLAPAYAALGDTDRAFHWLEVAYRERVHVLPWIRLEPMFASLRADARFQDLLGRMGVPGVSPPIPPPARGAEGAPSRPS